MTHFLTVAAVTLVLGALLWRRVLRGAWEHPFLFVLTTAAMGLGLGAAWESVEWGLHNLGFPVVHGLADTETDLLVDLAGALVGATAALLVVRRYGPTRPAPRRSGRSKAVAAPSKRSLRD